MIGGFLVAKNDEKCWLVDFGENRHAKARRMAGLNWLKVSRWLICRGVVVA